MYIVMVMLLIEVLRINYYHNPNDQILTPDRDVSLQTGGYLSSGRDITTLGIFLFDDRRIGSVGPVPGTGTYEGSQTIIFDQTA